MPLDPNKILDFIKSSSHPVKKNEIARALRIKGEKDRIALKQILKQLHKDKQIQRQHGGTYTIPEGLTPVCVVEVVNIDIDGDVFATPTDWKDNKEPPRIEVMPGKKGHPALGLKDRALVRLKRAQDGTYEARIIRKLDDGTGKNQIIGVYRVTKRGGIITPANKKAKYDFDVNEADKGEATNGDLVIGEVEPARGLKRKRARIIEVFGNTNDPKAISLLSMTEVGMREAFPEDVIKETQNLKVPPLKKTRRPSEYSPHHHRWCRCA